MSAEDGKRLIERFYTAFNRADREAYRALLFDAIRTVAEAPIGAHAIFADAIDAKAAAFYAAFGFTPLTDRPNTLYLPVATAQRLLSGETP